MIPNKTLTFKNVIMLKPYLFVLMALTIMTPFMLIDMFLFGSSVKLLCFFVFIGLVITLVIGKMISKTVTISFTESDICFDINGQLQTYPKNNIKGFYSINYANSISCMLVLDLYLNNGRIIHLFDNQTNTAKADPAKHQLLKDLLGTLQTELGFVPTGKNKFRTWTNTANIWYSKPATGV